MIVVCDQRFIFTIRKIGNYLYFYLPFLAKKQNLTREITLSKVFDLMPVMNNCCEVQYQKRKDKGDEREEPVKSPIEELSVNHDSSKGNYFIEFLGGKFHSIRPETLKLSEGDIFYLALTDITEKQRVIQRFLAQPVRYEDDKVKIY